MHTYLQTHQKHFLAVSKATADDTSDSIGLGSQNSFLET